MGLPTHFLQETGKSAGPTSVIQRALDRPGAFLKHVGVDHGGFDILVTEKFLDSTDVVAILEKLGGKSMTEGVRADTFGNRSLVGGVPYRVLQYTFIQVMPPDNSGKRIHGALRGWEYVLPTPFPAGIWIFYIQGIWQGYLAIALMQILVMQGFYVLQMGLQLRDNRDRVEL